jgi:pSer/pThr/pTyr-binding forkhead associated (FHA) protein
VDTAGGPGTNQALIDEPPADVAKTTNRSELLADPAAQQQIAGPSVLAGYCPAHHLSPPHAARCRVCGAAMAQQQGFEIARPVLGVLRLSTGDVVSLDRGVLMGRAPEHAGGEDERPHVLRLASPENDISRNHAEVLLDGWHVYVRDLGSTNGTVVTLPGQPPVRLRPDDLQLLEHGAGVRLADEVSFTFEVTS